MADKDDETEGTCINCLAQRVAGNVLANFTDEHPEVQMSYGTWMELGVIIEEEIKAELGLMGATEEATETPVTVQ